MVSMRLAEGSAASKEEEEEAGGGYFATYCLCYVVFIHARMHV